MRRTIRRIVAAVAVLAGGWAGAGTPPAASPGPQAAALAVFHILQKQDWAALYHVAAFSEQVMDQLPADPAVFAADVEKGIGGGKNKQLVDQMFNGMSDLAVGGPDLHGDYVTLPTSCTITIEGKPHPFTGTIHLIRRQHTWKWDLTFTNNPEEATAKALGELVGKPVGAPSGQ